MTAAAKREAAIAAAKTAAAAHTGHTAGLFALAAEQMKIAHQMAAASAPDGPEVTGVSKSKQQMSERDVEDLVYQVYAERMGITERSTP
jgi:hypothetical protein